MKSYTIVTLSVLFVILTAFVSIKANVAKSPEEGEGIKWMSFEQAVKLNAKKPKKMIIDVYTDWCGWCKVMDKQTFSDPIIIEYVNANYYAVKLNAEMTDKLTFEGVVYEFTVTNPANNKGYHTFAAKLLDGKLSYPSTVVLDEQYNRIGLVPGFLRPEQFDQMLKYYGGNHNKTTPYEEFTKNYKSPYGQ